MYKQVKDENDQLRDELEGLKKKLETKDVKSSATSWSEVGGEELLPSPPPEDTLGGSFEAYSWWKQGGVGVSTRCAGCSMGLRAFQAIPHNDPLYGQSHGRNPHVVLGANCGRKASFEKGCGGQSPNGKPALKAEPLADRGP